MSINTKLPIEIITEIFMHVANPKDISHHCVYSTVSKKKSKESPCSCWKLDLLGVAMVCTQWHSIASHVTKSIEQEGQSWIELVNQANKQRMYPFRPRFTDLLDESYRSHLSFHLCIRRLVIDFQSFNLIMHNTSVSHTIEILKLCPNLDQLDIVFDASFSSLVSDDQGRHLFSAAISRLAHCIQYETKCRIKQLKLTGHNPLQRCPCCAGKLWDVYLTPLIESLHYLDTLVLDHVLPSTQVLEALSCKNTIHKIILYNSIIIIPRTKEASKQRMTTIGLIPDSLWKQIKEIEIYEDTEESTTWPAQRHLLELAKHVDHGLQSFLLQFGTLPEKRQEMHCLRPTSPFLQLKAKCGESLKHISLVNVPDILL